MDELQNGSHPSQNGPNPANEQGEEFEPSKLSKRELQEVAEAEESAERIEHIDIVGRYIKEAAKYRLLSHKEVVELAKRNDDWGKEQLVLHNLRLVLSIARKYLGLGLDFEDLVQAGNTGLLKTVEKFNYTRGYKFSTCAWWWIRSAITRTLSDQSKTIRLPTHVGELRRKISKVAA